MSFWEHLAKPLGWIIALNREQLRSLFGVAMLGGLMSNSLLSAMTVWTAVYLDLEGEQLRMVLAHIRNIDLLSFWFAGILGLVVFGADYFKAKIAGQELSAGKGSNATVG